MKVIIISKITFDLATLTDVSKIETISGGVKITYTGGTRNVNFNNEIIQIIN